MPVKKTSGKVPSEGLKHRSTVILPFHISLLLIQISVDLGEAGMPSGHLPMQMFLEEVFT